MSAHRYLGENPRFESIGFRTVTPIDAEFCQGSDVQLPQRLHLPTENVKEIVFYQCIGQGWQD